MDEAESDLIGRARAGDRAAIESLLSRHQPDMRRFARRMCRTSEDADDAVQHTMMQVATRASMFRNAAKLASWLFVIVKRECTRLIARMRRHDLNEDALDRALAEAHDPDLHLALEAVLARLDPPLRDVLLLRDVEELTGPEAAAQLGISLEAMKTRLHRARAAMREELLPRVGQRDPR